MADFTALNSSVDRLIAKSQADEAAIAAANQAAADVQPAIDALAAKIDAVAPAPAV